ncbi:hypothetical protein JCM10908_006756 [Rhodotorula pacifica]|uniref:uncharacterized protein n=1 Tax=Rhodotorula pacifica TaxID=1495444 RepID=UPI00318290CC
MVLPRHPALRSPLHRIPVLWSLYRPLLRSSRRTKQLPLPEEHVSALQSYIRQSFKEGRHLAGIEKVRRKLVEAEQLLRVLEEATTSSTKANQVRTLAAHLAARESLRPPRSSSDAVPAPEAARRKPKIYPSIMHSTQFYHPIPRLRPQPIGISMTIFNRRRTSQRRFDKLEQAKELIKLAQAEERFEFELTRGGRGGGKGRAVDGAVKNSGRLGEEWREWIKDAREREKREAARSKLRISPELQAQAREANRARERRRAAAAAARRASATAS